MCTKHGRWHKWRACDIGEVMKRLENEQSYIQWTRAHSPTLPLLHLHHSSFSNLSVALPTSQLMSRAHSPTFPSLHLHHSSSSNPSVTLPMSQLILQPFRCFTYITVHSPTLLSLLLCHKLFTYVTWRAAQAQYSFYRRLSGPWDQSTKEWRKIQTLLTPRIEPVPSSPIANCLATWVIIVFLIYNRNIMQPIHFNFKLILKS